MSIEQQNRIIAEFMGLDLLSPEFTVLERNCEFMYDRQGTVADLEYHSSWDWLMPVGKKILEWLQTEADKRSRHMCTEGDLIEVDITCAIRVYNKEEAHKHIVRWIEWYNLKKILNHDH